MKKIIFLMFLFMISSVSAHLDAGEDKVIDDYIVDFGYSPAELESYSPVTFAFNLVDKDTEEPIDIDAVWVRISSKEVVFAGTFQAVDGNVALTYAFPKRGEYEITARFIDNGETIVETDFNVSVAKNKKYLQKKINGTIGAVIVGFILGMFYFKKKWLKKKK